jgi:hypothetical protein
LDFFVVPDNLFFGDGTGDFSSTGTISFTPKSAITGDFNLDGRTDLLCVDENLIGGLVYILLNNGSGSFTPSPTNFSIESDFSSISIEHAVADIDSDCNSDFIITAPNVDSTGNSVLYLGFGDGLGGQSLIDSMVVNGIVQDLLLTDVDRDNKLDIVAANGTAQRVEIYRGNGDRTFDSLEFFSTALAGNSPFSLATADFNRDGQPDFLSGSSDSGSIVLNTNTLADLPVLPDEMVVTALTNTTLRVTNPYGYQTSEQIQTIAGGDIWRLDVNGNDSLDEQVIDYNLVQGYYDITAYLRPEFEGGGDQPVTVGIRIDGSQQVVLLDNYPISSIKRDSFGAQSCLTDSVKFSYFVGEDSSIYYPFSGVQTNSTRPNFFWGGLVPNGLIVDRFHLQIGRLLDFQTLVFGGASSDSLIPTENFSPCMILKADSLYYWRVRWHDGGGWSSFTNAMALSVGNSCCIGLRGDANNDGANCNILDLNFVVNRIFRGGPCALCPNEADMNSDGIPQNILDLNFAVNRIFRGGPAPGPCL